MNVTEALEFIHSVCWLGSKPGLDRTRELLSKIGNPEKKLKFVHVAGTNGKGSTCSLIASSLIKAGYKTALFTSPFIFTFNERMQINGEDISDEDLARFTEEIAPHAKSMSDPPTEFELVTCLALLYFAEKECDIVVLEVGMGGLLDSTNIIESPECSVITNIGLEHTKELGDTLEKIAHEKAGIIKTCAPVVLYKQSPEVSYVVESRARELSCPVRITEFDNISPVSDSVSGQRFKYENWPEIDIPLLGAHQLKNASVALDALTVLRQRGWEISDEAVVSGFKSVSWPARFDIVSDDPLFVIDGGHNAQCAETVAANIRKYFPAKKCVILIGVMADKDYTAITDILSPIADEFVAVTPSNFRSLDAKALAKNLERYNKPVTPCESIDEGVRTAIEKAGKDGISCCVGSLYMVGDVKAAVERFVSK